VLSVTENVSAYNVRACTWRVIVHGVRACARHACVCLPASRFVSVSHGLSDSLHTACVRACTGHACVHTACVRAHCVHSCVRAHGVRTCVHIACTRSVTPCVRSHGVCACVPTACVRACTLLACTRRGCVHPSSAVAVVHRSLLQLHHHMACARAHDVRACTRCACVHTACLRAHGTCVHTASVCAHGDHWCIHPAPSPSCAGRCYSATIIAACSDAAAAIVCSSAGVYTGALVGPPCKPRLPRCATCHRDAVAVASCTLRPQSGPASTDAGIPCSCCNRIRDLVAVIDPLCCRGAPALPPFCAAC
jgi:hypothetical protein